MPKDLTRPPVTREKIFNALYEAAELEHCLMCTYLYALFSLRDGEGEGLTVEEARAVGAWRRTILGIAVGEMSHLIAVWNITAALGAAPRFGRANFPLHLGYLPANLVVRLAPFSEEVIQHFIYLERPEGSSEHDGSGFEPSVSYSRAVPGVSLTPTGYDYQSVGEFYEEISGDLTALANKIGEEVLFCGDPALQLTPAESSLPGAKPVINLESALAAIEHIVIEGEGAPRHRENSHFQRFRQIREELRSLKAKKPGFTPAYPSAENPVLRRPPQAEGHVWLHDKDAVATVDLANAVYALMLRLLAKVYALPTGNADKILYVRTSIGLMQVLTQLGELAARLPAGPSYPGRNAGVSFTSSRNAAALPSGSGAWRFFVERMEELSAAAATRLDLADPRCARAAQLLGDLTAGLMKATPPHAEPPPTDIRVVVPPSGIPESSVH